MTTLAAALAAALVVPANAPATIAVSQPAPIVERAPAPSTAATTSDKTTLAVLSLIDIIQTERWLHTDLGPNRVPPRENDPLLGEHPSLARMAVTGIVLDEAILHIRSPFVRRLSIGIEAANCARNFSIGMAL